MEYIAIEEPVLVAPPSNKEIRLAIDLAKQMNPLFEFYVQDNIDLVRRICKYDIPQETILNVKSFKQILYKEIIVSVKHTGNGKYNLSNMLFVSCCGV